MVLALIGLLSNLDWVRNQLLTIPTYDMFSEQLLCLSVVHAFRQSFSFSCGSFAHVIHSYNRGVMHMLLGNHLPLLVTPLLLSPNLRAT